MQAVNVCFKCGTLTLLLDYTVNLAGGFLNHFLDASRMDTAVCDKLFKASARNLAAYRIKSRKNNCLGCIVDNNVNTCKCLNRTDVTAFTTDNSSLHLVIGKSNNLKRWFP